MSRLPRLHLVTDDEVLSEPGFVASARAALAATDRPVALHLRGPRSPVRALLAAARALEGPVAAAGAWLVVNDRLDLAAGVGARGVQLGARSLPVERVVALRAEGLIPASLAVGVSVHAPAEAARAVGADWLVAGTVFASASHPGRPGRGTPLIRAIAEAGVAPVVAIGGVTPARVSDVAAAGAYGVAVLSGVWRPQGGSTAGAVKDYLEALATAFPDLPGTPTPSS